MTEKVPRFAIMGSGGVGGYFGAVLARAGHDVTFIARGDHLNRMVKDGLSVQTPSESFHLPVTATEDPAQVGPVDFVLFAVKLWDTERAAAQIGPMLGADSAIVSLQNGVASGKILIEHHGAHHVFGGVAEISSVMDRPGRITCHSPFARIFFGEMGAPSPARSAALSKAFQTAGIEHTHSPEIDERIWSKFVFLVGLSGITASTRKPIGEVRETPEGRANLMRLMDETHQIATAKGILLPADVLPNLMAFIDSLPPKVRASMAEDLDAGRPLELDWLSGAVSRMGQDLGIPTPANDAIVSTLRHYAGGSRGRSQTT